MPAQHSKRVLSTLVALPLIVVCLGLAGRSWLGAPATAADIADPAATATRRAELVEIDQLRTEVADLKTQLAQSLATPTATLVPSPTPTPTQVPPAAMNQPLPYGDIWTVTAVDVTKTATVSGYGQSKRAEGIYVVVHLQISNNSRDGAFFPFRDLILVDDRGRVFEFALTETVMVTGDATGQIPPSVPTDAGIVFDVTTDVGDSFILESRKDPTFRVQLQVVLRG